MTTLTTDEKIKLIEDFEKKFKAYNTLLDQAAVTGLADSKIAEAMDAIECLAIDYISELVDDPWKWISWYFFECNPKCNECSFEGKKYKIKNVKDLVKFMELSK